MWRSAGYSTRNWIYTKRTLLKYGRFLSYTFVKRFLTVQAVCGMELKISCEVKWENWRKRHTHTHCAYRKIILARRPTNIFGNGCISTISVRTRCTSLCALVVFDFHHIFDEKQRPKRRPLTIGTQIHFEFEKFDFKCLSPISTK